MFYNLEYNSNKKENVVTSSLSHDDDLFLFKQVANIKQNKCQVYRCT